jgi:hypothetical protein
LHFSKTRQGYLRTTPIYPVSRIMYLSIAVAFIDSLSTVISSINDEECIQPSTPQPPSTKQRQVSTFEENGPILHLRPLRSLRKIWKSPLRPSDNSSSLPFLRTSGPSASSPSNRTPPPIQQPSTSPFSLFLANVERRIQRERERAMMNSGAGGTGELPTTVRPGTRTRTTRPSPLRRQTMPGELT